MITSATLSSFEPWPTPGPQSYTRMLLGRDQPGDHERAHALLTEARAIYSEIGMPKHVEMVDALLEEAS